MQISATGLNLSILIFSQYDIHHDWMAFSCWYSIQQNLPDAKVIIMTPRPKIVKDFCYSWCYRVSCDFFQFTGVSNFSNKIRAIQVAQKNNLIPLNQPLMVIDADMVAVNILSDETLNAINDNDVSCIFSPSFDFVGDVWLFKNITNKIPNEIDDLIKENNCLLLPELGCLSTECQNATFVQYKESCGSFVKKTWMEEKVYPPFLQISSMLTTYITFNETKVFNIWKKIGSLFEVLKTPVDDMRGGIDATV